MNLKSSILFIIITGLFISCDNKRVFDEYQSVGSAWNLKKEVVFELPKMDTVKKYNLFINLRANDDYKFNNAIENFKPKEFKIKKQEKIPCPLFEN